MIEYLLELLMFYCSTIIAEDARIATPGGRALWQYSDRYLQEIQLPRRERRFRFQQSDKNSATQRESLMDFCSGDVVAAQLTVPMEKRQLELTVRSDYFAGDIKKKLLLYWLRN
ncbi:hypothetical protein JTB14_036881 [Gonioctena quinquepunctata]|nr:hypothetical protein JTB14_036881 [Gonioctena quinquepunctata]